MERSRTHRLAHNRCKPIQMTAFVARFGALLIAMASFPAIGLAQSNLPPQTDSRSTSATRPNTQPIETQAECRRRWAIVSRVRRTCRQASCGRKAAKAGALTPRWSWTRNWNLQRVLTYMRRRNATRPLNYCARSITCQPRLSVDGAADHLPDLCIRQKQIVVDDAPALFRGIDHVQA